jgi:O-antigen ligase
MLKRIDTASMKAAQGAAARARVFALIRFSLVAWACIHFALVAVTGFTYVRSFAFGFAAVFALWLVLGAIFSDNEPIPIPDSYLWVALAMWAGWSAASYFWSVHPEYTKAEIGTEVGWGLTTAAIYYVAARSGAAFRAMVTTAVAVAAFLAVLAIYVVLTSAGADPEKMLVRTHGGVGAFSTYLVLVLAILPLLLAPRPMGYGTNRWSVPCLGIVFVLLLIAARVTENRMIWLAFAMGFIAFAVLASWRWRNRLVRAPWRWTSILLVLLVAVGTLFVDAAMQRAKTDNSQDKSVAQLIADDPRLMLWQHTFERIRERPWIGFGFGKSILRTELSGEMGDPMLAHAHNLFVSQWLQTGVIGVATLVALLAALAWRYATFMRGSDGMLAAIGLAGLVVLIAFVVKNLTDDFMMRPTSKEFWAINALLVGYGIRRARATP